MAVSPALHARRAFVKVMIALASVYGVLLGITRDSPDAEVVQAHKKLVRKVHPDKEGTKEHAQQLQAARELWTNAKKNPGRDGRSKREDKPPRSKANAEKFSEKILEHTKTPVLISALLSRVNQEAFMPEGAKGQVCERTWLDGQSPRWITQDRACSHQRQQCKVPSCLCQRWLRIYCITFPTTIDRLRSRLSPTERKLEESR